MVLGQASLIMDQGWPEVFLGYLLSPLAVDEGQRSCSTLSIPCVKLTHP